MGGFKIGDIVARKSYGGDILFKVAGFMNADSGCTETGSADTDRLICLKGINYRLEADAPERDLELQSGIKIAEYIKK